jgi:hydroxymethylbilane synthase
MLPLMPILPRLRLGTRGSPLALAQTREVAERLAARHAELTEAGAIEIKVIRTSGDKIQDRRLAEIGGKGLFTKEIEEALLEGAIDAAVHSMKDMPTILPTGLVVSCILPREDPRDALICAVPAKSLAELPPGARVGTASLRRQAQLLMARPDLRVVPLRGNVQTRLRKLAEGEAEATLLALAGLRRLGQTAELRALLEPEVMLPAVAQGAIGVERRAEDQATAELLAVIDHRPSRLRVECERAFLAELDGSCRTPIAALAEFVEPGSKGVRLRGLIAAPDGSQSHAGERLCAADDALAAGRDLGAELRKTAGPAFFEQLTAV